MDAKYFAEIRAREQAATPGPWEEGYYGAVCTTNGYKLCNVAGRNNDVFVAHSRTDIPALLAEVERLTEIVNAYAQSARTIAFCLDEFCNRSLPYDEMIADAARKADEQIATLKKALELACHSRDYTPSGHELADYFIHQAQEQEGKE